MAKNAVSDWSTTAASNTDIAGINIDEGMAPSGVNNAIRAMMSQIATFFTDSNFTLTSTDAGAAAGPLLTFYRNSASPAANDVMGEIIWQGKDSAANQQIYALDDAVIDVATSGAEKGIRRIRIVDAGTVTTALQIATTGLTSNYDVKVNYVDAGALAGPNLMLFRDSSTPAASDVMGKVLYQGRDSAANVQDYVYTYAQILDPVSTVEDAQFVIGTQANGSFRELIFYGYNIYPSVDNNAMLVAGGLSNSSAYVQIFGHSHASQADDIVFNTNGNVRYQWDDSAAAHLLNGLVDISNAASGQVKFPASQNASPDANTLDDYEEGAFTPAIAFGGASVGITYTTQVARYTKIGRLVAVEGNIVLSAKGSSVGAATITGLPFASGLSAGGASVVGLSNFTGLTAGLQGVVSGSTILIRSPSTTGAGSTADTNFSATSSLQFSAVYSV